MITVLHSVSTEHQRNSSAIHKYARNYYTLARFFPWWWGGTWDNAKRDWRWLVLVGRLLSTLSTILFLILSRLSESVWQQIPLKSYQRHHPSLHPPTEAAKWVGCKQDSGSRWLAECFILNCSQSLRFLFNIQLTMLYTATHSLPNNTEWDE